MSEAEFVGCLRFLGLSFLRLSEAVCLRMAEFLLVCRRLCLCYAGILSCRRAGLLKSLVSWGDGGSVEGMSGPI